LIDVWPVASLIPKPFQCNKIHLSHFRAHVTYALPSIKSAETADARFVCDSWRSCFCFVNHRSSVSDIM